MIVLSLARGFCVLSVLLAAPAVAQKSPPPLDTISADSEIEKMASGNYPAMKRDGVLVGAIQRAWDGSTGTAGILVVRHAIDQVIKIRLREFMTTTIVLPEWEAVSAQILGDGQGFKVVKTQPHILVASASITGADTSLTVIGTSGRVYAFYVRAEGYNSPNIPDLTVFVKADAPDAKASSEDGAPNASASAAADGSSRKKAVVRSGNGVEAPDFLAEIAFDPSRLRFDFSMSGDRSIAPDRVFSDGIFTYFDYGNRWNESDLPAVYRVVDGVDTPVNTRSKGALLIAESAGAFTLRNGQRVVCVRPDGHVPDGSYTPIKHAKPAGDGPTDDRALP